MVYGLLYAWHFPECQTYYVFVRGWVTHVYFVGFMWPFVAFIFVTLVDSEGKS